jgi:hypothetical protein
MASAPPGRGPLSSGMVSMPPGMAPGSSRVAPGYGVGTPAAMPPPPGMVGPLSSSGPWSSNERVSSFANPPANYDPSATMEPFRDHRAPLREQGQNTCALAFQRFRVLQVCQSFCLLFFVLTGVQHTWCQLFQVLHSGKATVASFLALQVVAAQKATPEVALATPPCATDHRVTAVSSESPRDPTEARTRCRKPRCARASRRGPYAASDKIARTSHDSTRQGITRIIEQNNYLDSCRKAHKLVIKAIKSSFISSIAFIFV